MGFFISLNQAGKTSINKSIEQHDIDHTITEFFAKHPYVDDDEVHKFAMSLGMEPDEFESLVYKYLSSFLCEGKSKNDFPPIDNKELEMGIAVEYEHTTNKCIAKKIATDHLTEIPDYYTRLKKMEKEAEKAGMKKSLEEIKIENLPKN